MSFIHFGFSFTHMPIGWWRGSGAVKPGERGKMIRCVVSIALLLAVPAAARSPGEWLAPSDRETLDVVEIASSGSRTKTVYVGRGETAETWTRRITIWSAPDYVLDRAAFAEQAARIRQGIISDCPGVRATELREFQWSGRPAAEYLIVCLLYPMTGRQDIYLVRSIAGRSGDIAAALTFRRPPTEAETARARAYLDTLLLCTPARDEQACSH
jgi:hypothetical protein